MSVEPSELAGRYQIVSRLGAGAFGTVYKAKDKILGRMIAIKTIRFDGLAASGEGRDELMTRFKREAQVSAQLRHPNIVTIYDVGEDAGISYLAMEFIDGVGLDRVISGHGQVPIERAASIAAQVADALDYAHRSGVVHRDIKPANVMIEEGDRVKVADFGIAKSMNSGEHLTMTGGLLGTPSYMSPEQARGGQIDGRTDLFALGCILYEMLAGKKAFRGESVTALIFKILSENPEPLGEVAPGVPREMIAVVEKAITKDAGQRYQTGRELADDLKRLTLPAFTPTLRAREMPTAPVRTTAGGSTSPAYAPPTLVGGDPTTGSPPVPPTVVGAAPTRLFHREDALPPLPPPPPATVRRGGGFLLVAGLGFAALLIVGLLGFAAWRFLGRSKTLEVAESTIPTPAATAQSTEPAIVEPSSAVAPPSAAPSAPPTNVATANNVRLTPAPITQTPLESRVVATRTPAVVVSTPAPDHTDAETMDEVTELDRPPDDVLDGSEAGRRVAEAYRSGTGGRGATPLRARNPIPPGLARLETRMAVNLYNLATLQEDFHRREGRYAPLAELLSSRRLSRWTPRGYRLDVRVGADEFEITAEPHAHAEGLRSLSVDETRVVRVMN